MRYRIYQWFILDYFPFFSKLKFISHNLFSEDKDKCLKDVRELLLNCSVNNEKSQTGTDKEQGFP